ncbi:MAG: AIPR family protein, partial [Paludibacteraceae bacterium]
NAQFEVVDKQGIEDRYNLVLEQTNPALNHTITLEQGKYLMTDLSNTKVLVAAVPLRECIKMPGIKDGTLFQKNVRQSLGINNTVNKKIKRTLNDPAKCRDFFFFHNGITAICNKLEDIGDGQFKFYGLSVVNGCQSLNTIISCSETVKKRDDAYVLIRFYQIPQRDRADSISINTNTQSAVKARDLRSNNKQVLKLKKAYEQKYSTGFFATKRGEVIPADKDKKYAVELSQLGKQAMAWYMQRPNLSYGETKIFDKYFSTLFKVEYLPEDVYALKYWFDKIMSVWTPNNPLGINEVILTMKAYAPYHLLYAVSAIFAKSNNQDNVPSPAECLRIAENNDGMSDSLISMAVNCLNNALETEEAKCKLDGRTFIPQNWIKNKNSINGIQSSIINLFSFYPDAKKMKEKLAMNAQYFSYRVKAADD